MDSSTQRHKRIARLQSRIVRGVAAVILALTLIGGWKQVYDNHQAGNQATEVDQRADFWRVIASDKSPNASNIKNKLAITLRDNLGSIDPNATVLPDELQQFKAGPNDYGGIESEINMAPFDNTGLSCTGCGSLSPEMKTKLLEIKQGKLQTVLSDEQAAVPEQSLYLAPFNLNLVVWIGLVYGSTTVAALVIAVKRDSQEHDYRASLLDWDYDGGSLADKYRRMSKLISPLYFVTVLPFQRKLNKDGTHSEALQIMGLTESDTKLRRALSEIRALPQTEQEDPSVIQQRELIESLLGQIDHQVMNHTGREDPSSVANRAVKNIQALTSEAESVISIRAKAIEELNHTDPQNS